MAQVQKRQAAQRDLVEQWIWYAEHCGVTTADRFLKAAESTLKLLAAHPQSGAVFRTRKLALRGLRRFPVSDGFEKILLFYFPLPDGVDLVRVVHGSRDLERLSAKGFFG